MTGPLEPVRLRFRGRMKRLPLMSFAAAFRRDIEGTARALDTLIQGPPETPAPDPAAGFPRSDSRRAGPFPGSSEGGLGGGTQEQIEQHDVVCINRQDMGMGGSGRRGTEDTAAEVAKALGDHTNPVAIAKLAREHPRPLLLEALRRTKAISPERIRTSPAAVFTGIARKLAAEGWTPPHRSSDV